MSNTPTGVPTSAPTLQFNGEFYFSNMLYIPTYQELLDFTTYSWIGISIAICILGHSFWMHRYKYNQMRIVTEISCVGVILTCVCQIITCYIYHQNLLIATFFFNIGCQTSGPLLVEIMDNYIFYSVYLCLVIDLELWKRVFLLLYAIIILWLSWLFVYTFSPIFVNVNSTEYRNSPYFYANIVACTGAGIYNVAFSLRFLEMLSYNDLKNTINKIFAIKCCLHAIISTIANVVYFYETLLSLQALNLFYVGTITISLHILFNMELEYFYLERIKRKKWRGIIPISDDVPNNVALTNLPPPPSMANNSGSRGNEFKNNHSKRSMDGKAIHNIRKVANLGIFREEEERC